ncbi:MAG: threonine-phosphate decarboxylase [Hyphomicrobiales bacterium]
MIGGHGGNTYDLARRLGCSPADILDLSSNVNPLGPPPGLYDHLVQHLDAASVLPEVDNRGIIRSYAEYLGVFPDRVIAGNGTTQFIFSIPGVLGLKKALIVGPTYSDYADACRLQRVACEFFLCAESEGFQPDLARLEKAVARAHAVFICNPNNPTGNLIPADALKQLCLRNPRVRIIVDESYLPFVIEGERRSLARSGIENLMVLLSLSKIFRIPGLRIGFLVAAPAIIQAFAGVMWPWSVNGLGQAAVRYVCEAGPALETFVAETRAYLDRERMLFQERLGGTPGLRVFPSPTSFFLVLLPEGLSASAVWTALADERILIRNCANFQGLSDRFIRISPKDPAANRRVAERLAELATQSRK